MNFVALTEAVISEVKIINLSSGAPLCRFTFEADGRSFNCLISGMLAYDFVYEVEEGTFLTFEARINDRMQLVLVNYTLDKKGLSFHSAAAYQDTGYPHKKIS